MILEPGKYTQIWQLIGKIFDLNLHFILEQLNLLINGQYIL